MFDIHCIHNGIKLFLISILLLRIVRSSIFSMRRVWSLNGSHFSFLMQVPEKPLLASIALRLVHLVYTKKVRISRSRSCSALKDIEFRSSVKARIDFRIGVRPSPFGSHHCLHVGSSNAPATRSLL